MSIKTILKILFPISLFVAVWIDAYYKFDAKEGARGYGLALFSYVYFCLYLSVLIFRRILKIKSLIIKLFIYICFWAIFTLIFDVSDTANKGLRGSIDFVIVLISIFDVFLLTFYFLYQVIFKNLKKLLSKLFRSLPAMIILLLLVSIGIWFYLNSDSQISMGQIKPTPTPTPTPITLIQPWQLNSRYKINEVVKFIKVDLDKDGKEELAAVTSYDKVDGEVFFYAGFYRYNPATEIWDEIYSEDLNIVNYRVFKEDHPNDYDEFKKKLIFIWSEEFVSLENLGDLTGDGCPEIAFSSLLQGKYFDNYIIIAQAGESHYRYKIFLDQNSMAKVINEDGFLIEKYFTDTNSIKDIYEWDQKNAGFKLIETQKTKITAPETPKVIPGLEELTS